MQWITWDTENKVQIKTKEDNNTAICTANKEKTVIFKNQSCTYKTCKKDCLYNKI